MKKAVLDDTMFGEFVRETIDRLEHLVGGVMLCLLQLWLQGSSHQPLMTSFINISDCTSVKSGGPTSAFQHNPQQFHNWNRTKSLV